MLLLKFIIKTLILLCCCNYAIASNIELSVPDIKIQQEIKSQLLEIALADVDYHYSKQFINLQRATNSNSYAKELMKAYFLINNFRNIFYNSSWENIQNNNYAYKQTIISLKDQEFYEFLLKNPHEFLRSIINLRPRTPNYIKYRQEIFNILQNYNKQLTAYKFVVLKPNMNRPEVVLLKKALKESGYLDPNCPETEFFDIELSEGVKLFQSSNNIKSDGIVGYQTYSLIFKTATQKLVSLARAILRQGVPALLSQNDYVFVNIPETNMYVYKNKNAILYSKVIVGATKRPTPRLNSAINNVVLNPTWTVPETIKIHDYLPKLKQDPFYLTKHGVAIVDQNNNVIDPTYIDFSKYHSSFPYRMVQAPGVSNALGLYKFNFPNSESIYLHSTSSPKYFTKATRSLSSGCVRVEKSKELAEYLLQNTYYTPEKIAKTIQEGKTKWVRTPTKTPIFLAYWTAYITEGNKLLYPTDIYQLDSKSVISNEIINNWKF